MLQGESTGQPFQSDRCPHLPLTNTSETTVRLHVTSAVCHPRLKATTASGEQGKWS